MTFAVNFFAVLVTLIICSLISFGMMGVIKDATSKLPENVEIAVYVVMLAVVLIAVAAFEASRL